MMAVMRATTSKSMDNLDVITMMIMNVIYATPYAVATTVAAVVVAAATAITITSTTVVTNATAVVVLPSVTTTETK